MAKLVEASYELSLLIAKGKRGHMIGKMAVKLCLLTVVNIVFGAESYKAL
jgi:hypothetical protein